MVGSRGAAPPAGGALGRGRRLWARGEPVRAVLRGAALRLLRPAGAAEAARSGDPPGRRGGDPVPGCGRALRRLARCGGHDRAVLLQPGAAPGRLRDHPPSPEGDRPGARGRPCRAGRGDPGRSLPLRPPGRSAGGGGGVDPRGVAPGQPVRPPRARSLLGAHRPRDDPGKDRRPLDPAPRRRRPGAAVPGPGRALRPCAARPGPAGHGRGVPGAGRAVGDGRVLGAPYRSNLRLRPRPARPVGRGPLPHPAPGCGEPGPRRFAAAGGRGEPALRPRGALHALGRPGAALSPRGPGAHGAAPRSGDALRELLRPLGQELPVRAAPDPAQGERVPGGDGRGPGGLSGAVRGPDRPCPGSGRGALDHAPGGGVARLPAGGGEP